MKFRKILLAATISATLVGCGGSAMTTAEYFAWCESTNTSTPDDIPIDEFVARVSKNLETMRSIDPPEALAELHESTIKIAESMIGEDGSNLMDELKRHLEIQQSVPKSLLQESKQAGCWITS